MEVKEARFGPIDINGLKAGVKVIIKLDMLPNRKEVESMKKEHVTARNSPSIPSSESKQKTAADDVFHGHIQEMTDSKGEVNVFIEEIGARLKVPYDALEKLPPSPPRSPWHGQSGNNQASGINGGQSYKNLSGYYQKTPIQEFNNNSSSRGKRKNIRQSNEMYNSMQGSSGMRNSNGSPNNVGRGNSNSRSRGQHHSHGQRGGYNNRNYGGRGSGSNRSYSMPETDEYPALSNSGNNNPNTPRADGVWGYKNNNNGNTNNNYVYNQGNKNYPVKFYNGHPKNKQQNSNSVPHYNNSAQPPPSPLMDFGLGPNVGGMLQHNCTTVAPDAPLTHVLHQVMSAGGQQEVVIMGQKVEVVESDKNNCQAPRDERSEHDDSETPQTNRHHVQEEKEVNEGNSSQPSGEKTHQENPLTEVSATTADREQTPAPKSPEVNTEEKESCIPSEVGTPSAEPAPVMMVPYHVEHGQHQQQMVACISTPPLHPAASPNSAAPHVCLMISLFDICF